MPVLTCEQVEELAPFYVSGALGLADAAAVEHHLASCTNHVETFAALRSAPASIGSEVPLTPSPPDLKSRLMAAIEADSATEPAPQTLPSSRRLLSLARPAIAAAVLLALVSLLAWNLSLRSSKQHGAFAIALAGDNGASATVFYRPGIEIGVIAVEGLPKAPDGQTYQVWAGAGKGMRSCGLLSVAGRAPTAVRMDGDVGRKEQLFVTLEPAGGSTWPSGPTVLRTRSR